MRLLRWTGLLAILGLAAAGAGVLFLQSKGITPRSLAPYVLKRSSGHNPTIVAAGGTLSAALLGLDRGHALPADPPALTFSPGAHAAAALPPATAVIVDSSDSARNAVAAAMPGQVIVFLPGMYRFAGTGIPVNRPGTAHAPITVRALQPGSVQLEFEMVEGFVVSAPYWRFENLQILGKCAVHSICEHAFHVIGGGHHFTARNNTVRDFNAHFKINGASGRFPDDGLIEGNILSNSQPRQTSNPVTPIDVVAASGWIIRRNLISDFVKGDGDRISYGAFAKGAGAHTRFEANVVLCEARLRGSPGQRVGLSLGGGGTGKPYCRDGKCITEQEHGIITANLIASCSDAGIYLNSAAASRIQHNTLVDTAGIDVRFAGSSADVDGNLVDGAIRSRNGALLRLGDNVDVPLAYSYGGYHPVRKLFRHPAGFDFNWHAPAPRREVKADAVNLCGATRPRVPRFGAFEDFAACLGHTKR